jgi:hypothetical protein
MSDTETTPIWRQALKDTNHPLYAAAWLLFSVKMNPDAAAQRLADQKEQVISFLYTILDTPELYLESALGSGLAPVNAVQLLGRWQVLDAIPRLLKNVSDESDFEDMVTDRSIQALEDMGPGAVDAVLEAAQNIKKNDVRITFGSILADIGKGDPRVWSYLVKLFERQKQEWDIRFVAEHLLTNDPQAGIAYLEERLRRSRYGKELREVLEKYLDDARKGQFP